MWRMFVYSIYWLLLHLLTKSIHYKLNSKCWTGSTINNTSKVPTITKSNVKKGFKVYGLSAICP